MPTSSEGEDEKVVVNFSFSSTVMRHHFRDVTKTIIDGLLLVTFPYTEGGGADKAEGEESHGKEQQD